MCHSNNLAKSDQRIHLHHYNCQPNASLKSIVWIFLHHQIEQQHLFASLKRFIFISLHHQIEYLNLFASLKLHVSYCSPTYGMHIHKACRSSLTYLITQNWLTLLLELQVDTGSYGTQLAPSTMTQASVQCHTTQMMFATRFTRRIRYMRMH